MMNYKVVMLDFDGTLARTIPAILHASEKMLKMHGYEIDPVQVERQLRLAIPPEESGDFCHRMVLFGRDTCTARSPKCGDCPLSIWCKEVGGQI